MYREKCGDDGFFKWLHVLLLMDDIVIMATSRARLQEKLNILNHFCVSYGMVVNRSKTKFMVLHGDNQDRQPRQLGDLWIDHCDRYTYLGAVFTADGSTNSAIKEHVKERQKHFNKLIMFLNTNKDMPFIAKRKVVEAAFNAALLYGCESWVGGNYHAVNKLYMGAIKCILGVRVTTTSDVCLIELGLPPLQALVKYRQQCFFKKMLSERQGMIDDPLIFAMDLTRERNVKLYDVIQQLLLPDHIGNALRDLRTKCWTSEGSKFKTYVQINPDLEVHKTYTKCYSWTFPSQNTLVWPSPVCASHPTDYALRLGVGHASPRDQRLCGCGEVQDERHVLQHCPLVQHIRDTADLRYMPTYPRVLRAESVGDFKYIYDVMSFFL